MKTKKTYRLEGVFEKWHDIKKVAEKMQVAPSIILLGIYAEVLSAYSMTDHFTIVVPGWQRLDHHPEINQLVGDFTSLSWLVISPQEKSLEDKILQYNKIVTDDFLHQDVSGLKILRKIISRKKDKILNFPVVFTDIHESSGIILPPGFTFKKSLSQTPQVYLDNLTYEQNGKLILCWDVADGIFTSGIIEKMFIKYQQLLNYLAIDSNRFNEHDFSALLKN